MAHWRFAFLILTLSVAAGCPNQAPSAPSAPAPAPASSPLPATPSGAESEDPHRKAWVDDTQADPRADFMGAALSGAEEGKAQDPLSSLAAAGPLLGRFESFSERGSQGTRSYRNGRLETVVLDGRSQQLSYNTAGELVKVETDDGRIAHFLRYTPEIVHVREFGPTVNQRTPLRERSLYFDPKTRLPLLYGTEGCGWGFDWRAGKLEVERGPRGVRSYAYDALGRLTSWRDDSNKSVTLKREGAATQYALADGQEFTLVQDAEGALREARQGEERYTFSHEGDALREAVSPLATIRYEQKETRRSVESPWGTTLTQLEGSAAPRASWIETPAGTFRFEYEAGQRSTLRYPNGVVARYTYRDGRDLQRLQSGVLDLARRYDERGRLVEERRDATIPSSYGYNGFGHLTRVAEAGQAQVYAYEQSGARTFRVLSPSERVLDESSESLALLRRVRVRQQERAGRKSGWEVLEVLRTYRSDTAGRLLEIKPSAGASDRFAYDGAGRLAEAQRAGGPKVSYAYDPLGRLSKRRVGEGAQARVTRYVYEGPRLLAELGPGQALRVYAHGPDLDEPLAYRDGEGPWTFLHGDERGTVLAYSDAAGERVDAVRFSAFGVLEAGPKSERPLFFAGHRYDPETRLVLARARAYDPELNRFLGPDPAGVRDGVNPFCYAQGNPLSFIDPLGLWAVPSTVRSHYGTLSPRAQLLLLQSVQGLRMSPNPKVPLVNLFKRFHPDVQLAPEQAEGQTRTGRGPAADLVERLAMAESHEEAQELMASPLAAAAKDELYGHQYKIVEGVARVQDDEERKHDSELLRELLAPTPEEEAAGVRLARRADLTMQFLDKYTDAEVPSALQQLVQTIVAQAGIIKRREQLGTRAAQIGNLSAVEHAEAQREIDELAKPRNLSARAPVQAVAAKEPISIGEFARRSVDSLRYYSAPDERQAYRLALRERRKLWLQHESGLASPESVARLQARDSKLKTLEDVVLRARTESRAADQKVLKTERAFRQALVKPLGYAEAWSRIDKDWDLFRGVNTPALLSSSMPAGRAQALFDPTVPMRPDLTYREAKRPDYVQRQAQLREDFAREQRQRAEAERERWAKERALARRAAAKAKRLKRRGKQRGITLPGERVAPRPSGVSMAAADPPKSGRSRGRTRSRGRAGSARKGRSASKPRTRAGRRDAKRAQQSGIVGSLGR